MATKTVVLSDALKAQLAKMLAAQEAEADAKATAADIVGKAETSCWSTLLGITKDALFRKAAKPKAGEEAANVMEETDALLSHFRDACKAAKEGGKPGMQKGVQYASDLRRLVKAVKAGKAIPKELWKATRSEYLNAEFWKEAGILAPSGAKKGKAKGDKPEAAEEGGDVGAAAGKAAEGKEPEWAGIVAQLRGAFRAEFDREAKELATAILAKQRQASGNGKPEAKAA